jgi:hypothetical protein
MPEPIFFGASCWDKSSVQETISNIALLDKDRAHYFLATHSPIDNLFDEGNGKRVDESTVYRKLTQQKHENLVLVHGDPGIGKSHLIHWLKLRCDTALANNELEGPFENLSIVLIKRRNGTLKDSLEQIVEQLGEGFSQYLKPIQDAIGKLEDDDVRRLFAKEMGAVLGPLRKSLGLSELPHVIANAYEFFDTGDAQKWVCRQDGTIHAAISQLTEGSKKEDLPQFKEADFHIDNPQNINPTLRNLIDDLEDDPEIMNHMIEACNEALPHAIKSLTGLTGQNISALLRSIRKDLKLEGKSLALFIEDVSVMVAVNEDVINAIEPTGDKSLCQMTAAVGMTTAGYSKLPENMKGRFTDQYHLRSDEGSISTDPSKAAEFVARYLNAIRLQDKQIREVAEARKINDEINISACKQCPHQSQCFKVFGSKRFGDNNNNVEVGLFPFNEHSPHKLLSGLTMNVAQNRAPPRAILVNVMEPFLADVAGLQEKAFPSPEVLNDIALESQNAPHWQDFETSYAYEESISEKARMRIFAHYWCKSSNAKDLAHEINPILDAFGLNQVSVDGDAPIKPPPEPDKPSPPKPKNPKPEQDTAALKDLRKDLQSWIENPSHAFAGHRKARLWIAELVRHSIAWSDYPEVPKYVRKELIEDGYQFVEIEKMDALIQKGRFSIKFKCNEETKSLIQALGYFNEKGKGTWDYEEGERDKRTISKWLYKNKLKIVEQCSAAIKDGSRPIRYAASILAKALSVHDRQPVPKDYSEFVDYLFSATGDTAKPAFSKAMEQFSHDASNRIVDLRQFLVNELSVQQADTGDAGRFIDPSDILEIVDRPSTEKISPLPEEYFQSRKRSFRYGPLASSRIWEKIPEAMQEEYNQIHSIYENAQSKMLNMGYLSDCVSKDFDGLVEDFAEHMAIQIDEKQNFPPGEELRYLLPNVLTDTQLVESKGVLENCEAIIDQQDPEIILEEDLSLLRDVASMIDATQDYLSKAEIYFKTRIASLTGGGTSSSAEQELKVLMQSLSTLDFDSSKQNGA